MQVKNKNSSPAGKGASSRDKRVLARSVAHACVGTTLNLALAGTALPQDEGQAAGTRLEEIVVTGRHREYLREDSSLAKVTEPLLNTPQSVATLSKELLQDRGMDTLNAALRTVPGITLGAGEFSWQGNNPTIRGFNSRNDLFLDGIRDFGSYPRDPFNLETVEVLMGPSSMLFGRGSTGGVINQVTKRPTEEARTAAHFNVGSDRTVRGALDTNLPLPRLGKGAAFRLNLMGHRSNVADRDEAESRRYGIAPSLAMELGSATRLTLSYMRQAADNVPDYGLPWFNGAPADVPRTNFYGFDSDYLETAADIVTAEVNHQYGERVELHGQLRYARYTRESRVTEPLILGVPASTPTDAIDVQRHVFMGDSEEDMLFGQVNARLYFETGPVEHSLVTGVEAGREGSEPTFAIGIGVPDTDLLNPVNDVSYSATGGTPPRVSADTVSKTLAVYALDTMKFGRSWQVIAGLRWDRFDADYQARRFDAPPTVFNPEPSVAGMESIERLDEEVSYRTALVYKPASNGSIYLSWGTSFNPSAEGLSFITTGRVLGLGNQTLEPEENESLELGSKWSLFDDSLKISGSLFQITKTNARVPDPDNPGLNQLAGEQQVQGLSVEVTGSITENWQLWSGYTYLDGEVTDAATGSAPEGADLTDAPSHNLSLWTTYRFTPRWQVGGGARYLSDRLASNSPPSKEIDGYLTFDAMAGFQLREKVLVKLNVTNVTDEFYIDQLHPWHVVPGPGLTAIFAVNTVF